MDKGYPLPHNDCLTNKTTGAANYAFHRTRAVQSFHDPMTHVFPRHQSDAMLPDSENNTCLDGFKDAFGIRLTFSSFSLIASRASRQAVHAIAMRPTDWLPFLIYFLTLISTIDARKPIESVLLSSVKSLTLRKDLKTTHNRVSAVPQLQCVGGSAKGLYEIDVLRCKNSGSSYGDEDIQWTCSASLPNEFKLGSTEVICEGFKNSEDPYVLKGSCGVEYRLMLTDAGEEKYGRKGKGVFDDYYDNKKNSAVAIIFWIIFVAVVCWIVYAAFFRADGRPRGGNDRPGLFGGGGGWGGGNDDPPPPYDYHLPPPKKTTNSYRAAPRAAHAQAQEGWRPGFWSGALGGAAAGYMAGNRSQNQQPRRSGSNINSSDNGEGSSRQSGLGSIGSSPTYGSSRHESSGFGGTSRR